VTASANRLWTSSHGRKATPSGEFHHADPVDADDFDCSPNSDVDVDALILELRLGINGGPWREDIDDSLIDVQLVPGTSLIVLAYDGVPVLLAHASEVGNRGAIEMAGRFREALDRRNSKKKAA
jgi:hypothetical protein